MTDGEVLELLTALIRNACVNDGTAESGQEIRSVETLEAYLGEPGERFEAAPGRTSVLYRVAGSGDFPSLMFLGHTDVVPVSEAGWSCDPFAAERSEGFVWGRGAIDMLNQTSAMAAVFKQFLGGAATYPGDLLFLAVADEEAGGRLGSRWLVEEKWDDVAADYLLTEIGTPALRSKGGWGLPVTVSEKGPHWRRFTATGTPGHGSQPYQVPNAVSALAEAVSGLKSLQPTILITDEWRRFVEAWGPEEMAKDLVDPDRVDSAIDRISVDDPGLARWVHACTRLTASPNLIRAGVKANVIADSGFLEVDVRSLPGQSADDVREHLAKAIGPGFDDLEYEELESTTATGSAPSGPLWDAIAGAVSAIEPDTHLIPTMIPVGTDARFFRQKGTVAYGVGLFDRATSFGDLLAMFHGHDERVSVESLGLTARLYRGVVDRLADSI
jgi:acetylornithine deacetylase/succinyl-diaminopimelate desuccinylase-like protein